MHETFSSPIQDATNKACNATGKHNKLGKRQVFNSTSPKKAEICFLLHNNNKNIF